MTVNRYVLPSFTLLSFLLFIFDCPSVYRVCFTLHRSHAFPSLSCIQRFGDLLPLHKPFICPMLTNHSPNMSLAPLMTRFLTLMVAALLHQCLLLWGRIHPFCPMLGIISLSTIDVITRIAKGIGCCPMIRYVPASSTGAGSTGANKDWGLARTR